MIPPSARSVLQNTSVWNALSPLGRKMKTPKGIFYWSGRAKAEADIDATIGTAQDDNGDISHLHAAEEWVGLKMMARAPGGKIFGYAPIEGVPTLRKKWLAKILDSIPAAARKNLESRTTMPTVTNGITHGLSIVSRMFLKPGQILITANKSWENYSQVFTVVNGIKVVGFPLFRQDELHLDAMIGTCREVAHIQDKVVLLLNFPHNRTGFMPSVKEASAIGARIIALCRSMPQIPFVILLDDAYEGCVYDAAGQKTSLLPQIFTKLPNLTVVKMDGVSKSQFSYGYRIGFLTFFVNTVDGSQMSGDFARDVSAEIGNKVGGFIRGEISQVNYHGQVLAEALLDESRIVNAQREKIIDTLRDRWRVMMRVLNKGYKKYGRTKLWADPCNGGFFCYLNLANGIDPVEIAERLITEKKIGVVPSEQGLRVAFCGVPKSKIERLISSIFEIVYRH